MKKLAFLPFFFFFTSNVDFANPHASTFSSVAMGISDSTGTSRVGDMLLDMSSG
jgi:hypothetical protein